MSLHRHSRHDDVSQSTQVNTMLTCEAAHLIGDKLCGEPDATNESASLATQSTHLAPSFKPGLRQHTQFSPCILASVRARSVRLIIDLSSQKASLL